jgi:hypothetical protein
MAFMIFRSLALAALLLAGFTVPSWPAQQVFRDERLIVFPDDSWEVGFSDSKPALTMFEFVPKGETVQNWTRLLTVQTFTGNKTPLADWAERFRSSFPERWNCDGRKLIPSLSGWKNGYPWMRFIAICNRNPANNLGEMALIHIVRGRENLFIVQRAWRGPPFSQAVAPVPPAEFQEWQTFMDQVVVCDPRYAENACPADFPPL